MIMTNENLSTLQKMLAEREKRAAAYRKMVDSTNGEIRIGARGFLRQLEPEIAALRAVLAVPSP